MHVGYREKLHRNVNDSEEIQAEKSVYVLQVQKHSSGLFSPYYNFCGKLLVHLIYNTLKKCQWAISLIQMDQK